MAKNSYDTVTEALTSLRERGYTVDFELLADEECIVCKTDFRKLSPKEFKIDATYRFEGESDPADNMILYAISSPVHNLKGIVLNGYGIYSDPGTFKIVEILQRNIESEGSEE